MRDPSIHITLSTFEKLLQDLEVTHFPTEAFFLMARKNSIDSRAVVASNKKTTKKLDNITLASHGDANLVANLIYATRIKLKQRGVRKITESNSREWNCCKQLADICNNFCNDFDLETRAGFITYIEIGLSRVTSNRNLVQKLISLADSISIRYEVAKEVKDYQCTGSIKKEVQDIYQYYVKYIANSTGIYEDFENDPEKYIHVCRVHELISERGWDYKDFINAQFEALSFCNGVPSLDNMYGDKAIERFNKYLYKNKNNHQETETPTISGSLWSKINQQ